VSKEFKFLHCLEWGRWWQWLCFCVVENRHCHAYRGFQFSSKRRIPFTFELIYLKPFLAFQCLFQLYYFYFTKSI